MDPPGFNFEPDDDELVEQYLLRQILGQQLPLDGEIIEDDPLSASPWELLKKHKLENDGFFFANGQTVHEKGNRQKRTCVDGCWEGQKPRLYSLRVKDSGTEITWKKYMLNFHRTGKKGSTGWVMHEYSITDPEDLASSSSLRLYRIRLNGYGQNSSLRGGGGDGDGGAQARADQEHISAAANSVFPTVSAVDLVDDEDGGSARPAPTSYADQVYQHQRPNVTYDWTQLDSFQDLTGANLGDYAGAGPGSHQYFMGGNTMDLGTHSATPSSDHGAPGVMNEYGAAPAAGLLPFGQGSFSGDEPFMDFELSDLQDFNVDEFLVFPDDPCSGLESPLNDQ